MLELNKYQFIKYLILDDKKIQTTSGTPIQVGYRPTRETIYEVGRLLPNCRILGWKAGYYGPIWALLITDPGFTDENFITMSSLKHQPPGPGFMRLLP